MEIQGTDRHSEEEVQEAKAKKRDVAEPRQPSAIGRVSPHPILTMEEQSDDRPAEHSGQHTQPAAYKIQNEHVRPPSSATSIQVC
jgi:hypothetical protein